MKWVIICYVLTIFYVAMACSFWIRPKADKIRPSMYEIKLEEAQYFSNLTEEK